jgi:hypothetical protein
LSPWTEYANKYGADVERVMVWDAFSDTFLDTDHSPDELHTLAVLLSGSPFTFRELGHILFCEVGPVCFSNTLWIVGGEGMGFGLDWLIPKCLERQRKNPFKAGNNPDELPLWMHLTCPLYLDAYLLLPQVPRLRNRECDE